MCKVCNGDKLHYDSFDELPQELVEKFKSGAKGKHLENAKNAYVDLINKMNKRDDVLVGDYINNSTKVLIKFSKCGCEHPIRPKHYRSGHGCSCNISKNMSKIVTNLWQNDEYRKMQNERLSKLWDNNDFRKTQSERMSKQSKEFWNNNEHRAKQSERMTKQLTEFWNNNEHRAKQSERMTELWQNNDDFRDAHSGKNHHNYNPDLTDEERKLNESRNHDREWNDCATRVKKRDNNTCQCCGHQQEKGMIAHHENGWDNFKEQRYDDDNIVTLCPSCHDLFHGEYGYGNNTKEQYTQFKTRYLSGEFNN